MEQDPRPELAAAPIVAGPSAAAAKVKEAEIEPCAFVLNDPIDLSRTSLCLLPLLFPSQAENAEGSVGHHGHSSSNTSASAYGSASERTCKWVGKRGDRCNKIIGKRSRGLCDNHRKQASSRYKAERRSSAGGQTEASSSVSGQSVLFRRNIIGQICSQRNFSNIPGQRRQAGVWKSVIGDLLSQVQTPST